MLTDTPVALAWGLPRHAIGLHITGGPRGERWIWDAQNLRVYCSDCCDTSGGTGWWDGMFLGARYVIAFMSL